MSYRDLLPHEQNVANLLEADGRKVHRTADDCFRSSCPAHDGDDENLAVYLNNDGIAFFCASKNCTHEEIRDSLGLSQKSVTPGGLGLNLLEYAVAKKLSPRKLVEYHVREVDSGKNPHLEIGYLGFDGLPIQSKRRNSMLEKPTQQGR